jgi:hypothetical protein
MISFTNREIAGEIAALLNDKSLRRNCAYEAACPVNNNSAGRYAWHSDNAIDLYHFRPHRIRNLNVTLSVDSNVPCLDFTTDLPFALDRDITAADQVCPKRSFNLG